MELQPKKSVSLSSLTFFFFILLGAVGWVVVLLLLLDHNAHTKTIEEYLIEIGVEVLKVVVIAAAAAIAVERVLLKEPVDDAQKALQNAGIKAIYPKRQDAGEEFLRLVRDDNIRRVTIAGISLRDFLSPQGSLHKIWQEIYERLGREQKAGLPTDQRLHIRLLLLLPNSNEGCFRNEVEGENAANPGGISFDIPAGLRRVRGAQGEIYNDDSPQYLQIRLYEHCPFAFIFSTESDVFVEQYDYRDQQRDAALPLLDYQSGTLQYRELLYSLEVIWTHANSPEFLNQVGTATAIREARVKNIYRRENRDQLTKSQADAVQTVGMNGSVDILAITGRFYISNRSIEPYLKKVSMKNDAQPAQKDDAQPVID